MRLRRQKLAENNSQPLQRRKKGGTGSNGQGESMQKVQSDNYGKSVSQLQVNGPKRRLVRYHTGF
jgi:hypothetical protein